MSNLWKVESGASKQSILPKTWTWVKYPKNVGYCVDSAGQWEWITILRVEFSNGGKVLRGRFGRYPDTAKLDETGHDDKNIGGWDGKTYHLHWSHTIDCDPSMPVGFWIWHDSTAAITLDGRQIKAKKV